MNKYEQEEAVNLPDFLKNDLNKIKLRTEKIDEQLTNQVTFLERYNEYMGIFKLHIAKANQNSMRILEEFKKIYWDFTEDHFDTLSENSVRFLKDFCRVIQVNLKNEKAPKITYEYTKTVMQLFPIDTLTEKTLQNIDALLDSSSASLISEHILLNWLAKAVEYASEKQKIITLRQKLIEYNTEMQEIMESISKLKKSKAKFIQNAKDISRYLDSDASYTNNSIDTTMNSRVKPSFSMSQASPQNQSAKTSFESLKIEKKTLKYSDFSEKAKEEAFDIVLEDSTELGCCSYKFFCFT